MGPEPTDALADAIKRGDAQSLAVFVTDAARIAMPDREFSHGEILAVVVRALGKSAARPGEFRYPIALGEIHRAIGGKRLGAALGLPVRYEGVRISVEIPKGAQLELGAGWRARSTAADFDAEGNLLPEAVPRLLNLVLGPSVSRMGLVAFALAHVHAAEEGREPDGRFWYEPSEIADLLGYPRTLDGLNRKTGEARPRRASKEAIKIVRRDFATYADTILRQTTKLPDGREAKVNGTLLYPTRKDMTHERRAGIVGREKHVEWRIRDELWDLISAGHVVMPVGLLHCGTAKPIQWARALRVYEALAVHARINAHAIKAGEDPRLGFDSLLKHSNVIPPGRQDRKGHGDVLELLGLLRARGAVSFKPATLTRGKEGIVYRLDDARMAELASIRPRRRLRSTREPDRR